MPLRCFASAETLYAFNQSDLQWDELKSENRLRSHLTMPCCGASVVLKKSKLGTRFFAHSKTDACTTAPETAEHLLAKNTIAKAILAAGWTASTEHRGDALDGDAWVADVIAIRGNRHVAIEVQWSKQHQDKTQDRQRRYARSEVRGLWLMRHPQDLLTDKATPTFRLLYKESSHSFSIMLPSVGIPVHRDHPFRSIVTGHSGAS